jgi:hypothetical protein
VVQLQQVDFDRGRTDGADHHEPAPVRKSGQRRRCRHPAHSVIHHINAPAVGQPLDRRADFCLRVKDDEVVNDSRGGGFGAGRATVHPNHFGAESVGNLRHGSPDTAGDAEDSDGFTRRQPCGLHRPVPRHDEVDADRGGFVEAEPFGFADQRLHRNRHQLCV